MRMVRMKKSARLAKVRQFIARTCRKSIYLSAFSSSHRRKSLWHHVWMDCRHYNKLNSSAFGHWREHWNLCLSKENKAQHKESIDTARFEWIEAFKLLSPCSIRWVSFGAFVLLRACFYSVKKWGIDLSWIDWKVHQKICFLSGFK